MLYLISLYYGCLIDSWAYPSIYPIISHKKSHETTIFSWFFMVIPWHPMIFSWHFPWKSPFADLFPRVFFPTATGAWKVPQEAVGFVTGRAGNFLRSIEVISRGWWDGFFFFLVIFRCTWGCCFRFWWTCGRWLLGFHVSHVGNLVGLDGQTLGFFIRFCTEWVDCWFRF